MKIIKLLFLVIVLSNLSIAQTAMIKTEALTPHRLTTMGFTTNSVSTGLHVVPNQTYVYLSAWNIGNNEPIISATFTLISKPAASTADLEEINPTWVQIKPDVLGTYTIELEITTASGSHTTTSNIYSSSFVGVGNFDGTSAAFPQCMACHASDFNQIFSKWQTSKHATIFKRQITSGAAHYGPGCIKCHTVGTDHNIAASNNGFDDIAANLGWTWSGPPNPGKWDSLKTFYPGLVNHATIGCENCHGPGREHAYGGHIDKIAVTIEEGVCTQCHDEPWRHNKYAQFENALHSEVMWSTSFAQGASSQNNSLQNCIRCHDGQGFVNFTKGLTTNTTGMQKHQLKNITCAACHDPHGSNNEYSLRNVPAGSDTLANGFQYTSGGSGRVCMNCHKSRRDNVTYTQTNVTNSHWGPHHSVQSDVFLGQNAAEFETPFISGYHKFALVNACSDCHMVATTDTGTVNRDKVGGHSFNLHNPETGYDHTKACVPCHGSRSSFQDFQASSDYDGDGVIESIRDEIKGLENLLKYFLPPSGVDSIDFIQINTHTLKKAYFNYQLISYDGSGGMHNPRFAIDVLTKSIIAINGVIPVQLISFSANVTDNNVNLIWETATEINNRGFEIEKKFGNSWRVIGFKDGKGTTTELNIYSFTDKLDDIETGQIYYRLKQIDFDGTFSYSKEIFVDIINTPKNYALEQNYPNPFNPTTTIKYSVPFDSKVKIVIYNVAGEMIAELFNSVVTAGNHRVEFNLNGMNLSSGIYFYSLEANAVGRSGSFKQTKKMVLLK